MKNNAEQLKPEAWRRSVKIQTEEPNPMRRIHALIGPLRPARMQKRSSFRKLLLFI